MIWRGPLRLFDDFGDECVHIEGGAMEQQLSIFDLAYIKEIFHQDGQFGELGVHFDEQVGGTFIAAATEAAFQELGIGFQTRDGRLQFVAGNAEEIFLLMEQVLAALSCLYLFCDIDAVGDNAIGLSLCIEGGLVDMKYMSASGLSLCVGTSLPIKGWPLW
jgi:hypothetical protein